MLKKIIGLVMVVMLAGCGGGDAESTIDEQDSDATVASETAAIQRGPVRESRRLAAWGDSMTRGLVIQLELLYPNRPVYMGGVSGEPSTRIRDRFLADERYRSRVTIIWAGRNNPSTQHVVPGDVAAMVAALPHRRFLVIGVPNLDDPSEYRRTPGLTRINWLNRSLADVYGHRFIDARSLLLKARDRSNPEDVIDFENGVPPSSLRVDAIHLTVPGSMLIAQEVRARIRQFGW